MTNDEGKKGSSCLPFVIRHSSFPLSCPMTEMHEPVDSKHPSSIPIRAGDEACAEEILVRFPEYVQPLLEALFTEVDRLSGRLEERLRQNQHLKQHFMPETAPVP